MARPAPLQPKGKPAGQAKRATPKAAGLLLQPKLEIGPPRDRYETEADRIADRVMRADPARPAAPPAISRLVAPSAQRVPAEDPGASSKRKEVRTMKVEDEGEDESTIVQKKGDGPVAAPARAEAAIGRMRSAGGQPLGAPVRSRMEGSLGRPLGHVRVHDGPSAARAAGDVGARAFTVGSDVFFGAGQYRPETPRGQHLLAHELVHTEQQKGLGRRAQTMPLQRDGTDPPPPPPTTAPAPTNAEAQADEPGLTFVAPGSSCIRIVLNDGQPGGTIQVPVLKLPFLYGGYKGATNHPKAPGIPTAPALAINPGSIYTYKGSTTRETAASQEFQKQQYFQMSEDNLEPVLLSKLPTEVQNWNAAPDIRNEEGEQRRYLRLQAVSANNTSTIIFGTTAELADHKRIKLPNWDRNGQPARFDVDHSHELQLGGLDAWDNFWLLDSTANQSSGREISSELQTDITAAIRAAQDANFWRGENAARKPSFETIKAGNANWQVEFAGFANLSISNAGGPYWTRAEILAGMHLRHLTAMTESELLSQGLILRGDKPAAVSIFTSTTGGFRKRFTVAPDGGVTPDRGPQGIFGGFDFESADINPTPGAAPYVTKVNGTVFRRRRGQVINPMPISGENGIPVLAGEGLGFSGYLDNSALMARIRALPVQATGMSPVSFTEGGIDVDGNIYANGMITATKALFPGLEVPIYVRGNDIYIEFPIPTDRLNFGPVRVTEAAIQIGVGEEGIFLSGNAGLGVSGVGSGTVEARVDQGNTVITGTFNFGLDFLQPAEASITYDFGQDTLSLTLHAGVQHGRLPGVESGEVTATFSRESIAISGSLQLGGPLSGTTVSVTYSPDEGLKVGADNIPLPVDRIPGISSATASLFARRDPTSGDWSFGGAGTAVIDIAGASGEIGIAVDGDKITFRGNLNVAKGPASGTISFTATNAPMDEDGNIVEGEATDAITVFGRGTAEITFGRVLRGSATIVLSPDASITISGTIGLPPTFEVFPRQEFNRDLFTIETPDFPIWGVSLGGVGIGIFAFADATISFNAYVGPGQLVDTQITATMDLDAPQDATITGSARFTVPAFAGLRLDLGGGLRARAAVAFVEGRVGLDGELGIEADASAGVQVAWNRTDGLSVEADVEANARPKFRLGINASVTAGVDLVLTEISHTWGPWRRTLGEFGPDMEMGVKIPVKWNEQNGVAFSLDDIEVKRPNIDARALLGSAFDTLV